MQTCRDMIIAGLQNPPVRIPGRMPGACVLHASVDVLHSHVQNTGTQASGAFMYFPVTCEIQGQKHAAHMLQACGLGFSPPPPCCFECIQLFFVAGEEFFGRSSHHTYESQLSCHPQLSPTGVQPTRSASAQRDLYGCGRPLLRITLTRPRD